jgi:hypothetical protein
MHHFGLALRRVRHRRHTGRCLRDSGEEDDENQWDALITQMSNIISLNNPYANIKLMYKEFRADQLLSISSAI